MVLVLAACGGGKKSESSTEKKSSKTETEKTADTDNIVKTFDNIDTEGMNDLPLQLESVSLLDDGTIKIIPLDEVKAIAETNKELKDGAAYPFEEIGKAKDIYLVRFGNGGYRTLIALMEDNSLAALSAKALIEDHIMVVRPNVGNRDDFESVEQKQDEDAFGVTGTTKDGNEIELDYSLDF